MTTKLLTTLLLLTITFNISLSQDKKFNIGYSLFPNYTIGILTNNGASAQVEEAFNELEKDKYSFSATFFIDYKINEKSTFGIGLGFHNTGEKTKPISFAPSNDPVIPAEVYFIYDRNNIEIPLYYKYKFGKRLYALAGLSSMVNMLNLVTIKSVGFDESKNSSIQVDRSSSIRKFNFSGNFGIGFDIIQNDKLNLFVQPYAQYGLLGQMKNAPLNRNFLSIGLSTGVILK